MSYALRITKTAKELMPFWERLSGSCLRIIVYEHLAARPHCHALVINSEVSTDTMKNWIKRALSVVSFPKADWSFKAAEEATDRYITYMSKGTLDPVFSMNYDLGEIASIKGQWTDYVHKMKTQPQLKPEETKLKWSEMLDIAEKRFRDSEHHADGIDRILDVVIPICRRVVYIESKALCGRFKFRDFVDTILARVYDGYEWGRTQKDFMRYRI